MGGIARICKMYGGMITADEHGNKIEWVWDYYQDKPRRKNDMTKKESRLSERAKREQQQQSPTADAVKRNKNEFDERNTNGYW